ncbi:hypothetical protein BDZ90DRAFT_77856 [Jaminaea rosea]|uniref:Uncharacterized protein n=1 Tax=Jaminaea rosea TaxID=1569628 RepID=A0A316UMF8_9BASI|nr:hypothetical protein BDZ90DRAFT_77856 [Jaminaea rosea]PWN25103.1 hypothetical protein BDZ90DRAFT_77856 [Jaminaea rosea]
MTGRLIAYGTPEGVKVKSSDRIRASLRHREPERRKLRSGSARNDSACVSRAHLHASSPWNASDCPSPPTRAKCLATPFAPDASPQERCARIKTPAGGPQCLDSPAVWSRRRTLRNQDDAGRLAPPRQARPELSCAETRRETRP